MDPIPKKTDLSDIYSEDSTSYLSQGSGTQRGRSISHVTIIPNTWKVCAAVAIIFSVTLILLAHYTGNGTLPAADWVTTGLKYSAWIVGGSTVLSVLLLIPHYRHEKKRLELREQTNATKATQFAHDQDPLQSTEDDKGYTQFPSYGELDDSDFSDNDFSGIDPLSSPLVSTSSSEED